jgi:hypothetical protein
MAFLDHEGGAEFPYFRDDVMEATLRAVPRLSGMQIESIDRLGGRVVVKAGMSLMSWGETIPIAFSESGHGRTRVSITSTPKTGALFGGAADGGKNRRNVESILSALSEELSSMPSVEARPAAVIGGNLESRLAKLKKLFDDSLITEDDYSKRKQEILSEI